MKIVFFMTVLCSILYSDNPFLGRWLVEGEGIFLNFIDSVTVSYDSEDESFTGRGVYSYTDTTLSAEIEDDDMDMAIEYRYRRNDTGNIEVKTVSLSANGEELQHDDEWYTIVKKEKEKEDE
ncbi:MAG: hypothetical protein ACQEQ4_04430 [Fibrobacterota bacterium]